MPSLEWVSVQSWGDLSNWRLQNSPISPFAKGRLRGISPLIAEHRSIHLIKCEHLLEWIDNRGYIGYCLFGAMSDSRRVSQVVLS